jgi:hypothetical protein
MVNAKRENLHADLRWRIRHFLTDDAEVKASRQSVLRSIREAGWPAVIFGGTIRDIMLRSAWTSFRDIDIVVGDATSDELAKHFGPYVRRRTRFGGLHLSVDGHAFDVWPLKQTWAFQEFPLLLGGDFFDLPRTTFLSIEAVCVELPSKIGMPRKIVEHGFFESLVTQIIELNFDINPFPDLSIVRAIAAAMKTGFSLGPKLCSYIAAFSRHYEPEQLYSAQCRHYGVGLFSVAELAELTKLISHATNWHPRRPVKLPTRGQAHLFTGLSA